MDMSKRRVGVRGSVVAAGSVWESRMKSDEVGGGVKVFNGEGNAEEGGNRMKRNQLGVVVGNGRRKTWNSESPEGLEKNPIQIARGKTEPEKNCGEQCKEMRISSSGSKKSPIQVRKFKIEGSKDFGDSADKFERSPIQTRKLRSQVKNGSLELKKRKSDSIKSAGDGNGESSLQLRKTKSEFDNGIDGSNGGCKNIEIGNEKNDDDDENCKDFGVCQKEVISSSSDNIGVVAGDSVEFIDDEADEGKEEEEVVDEEIDIEMEKRSFEVKEISIPEPKFVNKPEKKEPENQKVVNEPESRKVVNETESRKVVSISRKFQQKIETPVSTPLTVKQSPAIRKHSTIYQNFSKPKSIPKAEQYRSFSQTQNKLQSLVDLIMWRDISRSAFVFGSGTFLITSSSYAKDINLSVISVMSYMGLVYLVVIFLYRSLICRCGSSITIWKMAKLGFFGVFTVPKIYSSYSAQLTGYGKIIKS
ncbi:hypothetical protein TanjilG_26189 [Lupinus angustifolius]|uniref:Reticulon domain-containing protein n=1 Tax=Lupinus angustifolius TaxID=3871 RepID=A0A4P1R236_LUPAN|nr:hypothetical protein TanjilG_26189 [Lupinus angustifolius]